MSMPLLLGTVELSVVEGVLHVHSAVTGYSRTVSCRGCPACP